MNILKLLIQILQSVAFSPIGINIEFSQTKCLSDRETGHNLKSCAGSISTNYHRGQHDTSYYQPQPHSYYDQCQQ